MFENQDTQTQLMDKYRNQFSTSYPITQPQGTAQCPAESIPTIPSPLSPSQIGTVPNVTLPFQQQIVTSPTDTQYLNQFLATQIGNQVTVEFLIGTNTFIDKSGILVGVGTNYILIRETGSNTLIACDFYNIKFVRFYMK